MTCPRCRRPVPANEAAAYGGRHEDCEIAENAGEYANNNGGLPRALSAGENHQANSHRQVRKGVERDMEDWSTKR